MLLPQASDASHVLVIAYSCGHAPATVTSLDVTTGARSQLSVAVAGPPVSNGSVLSVHSIVTSAGHNVIVGGVLSSTVITCEHVLLLPQASVANQVLVMVYS